MLALLSDINKVNKLEVANDAATRQGSFVQADGTAPVSNTMAYAVWTEDAGADSTWSPDVTATGKLTVLLGGYRCKTDQFDSSETPAPGDPMIVHTDGKLKKASADHKSEIIVGYALEAKETGYAYKGSTYTVLHVHII